MSILAIAILAALAFLAIVGVGLLVLIKLGVIAQYALKEEPPEQGDFGLDQSREAGEP